MKVNKAERNLKENNIRYKKKDYLILDWVMSLLYDFVSTIILMHRKNEHCIYFLSYS